MDVTLGPDAERIVKDQLNSRRFTDAQTVVLAALKSLAARGPDEFEPGELDLFLEEGEQSIARDGTLDGDEALEARKAARGRQR